MCFVHSVHSSFVDRALYTFLSRSSFVYKAFIYEHSVFGYRVFIVQCVFVRRSFSVNSFIVRSSVCLHVCSAFVLYLCWNEMEQNFFMTANFTVTIALQSFARIIQMFITPGNFAYSNSNCLTATKCRIFLWTHWVTNFY